MNSHCIGDIGFQGDGCQEFDSADKLLLSHRLDVGIIGDGRISNSSGLLLNQRPTLIGDVTGVYQRLKRFMDSIGSSQNSYLKFEGEISRYRSSDKDSNSMNGDSGFINFEGDGIVCPITGFPIQVTVESPKTGVGGLEGGSSFLFEGARHESLRVDDDQALSSFSQTEEQNILKF